MTHSPWLCARCGVVVSTTGAMEIPARWVTKKGVELAQSYQDQELVCLECLEKEEKR